MLFETLGKFFVYIDLNNKKEGRLERRLNEQNICRTCTSMSKSPTSVFKTKNQENQTDSALCMLVKDLLSVHGSEITMVVVINNVRS